MNKSVLSKNWHEYFVVEGVQENLPGIYKWEIEGVGSYIGKYKSIRRPTKEYGRNVRRLLNEKPYRKGKPGGYRRIHRALAEAVQHGRRITLRILENVDESHICAREAELIKLRGNLNGPARSMSSSG